MSSDSSDEVEVLEDRCSSTSTGDSSESPPCDAMHPRKKPKREESITPPGPLERCQRGLETPSTDHQPNSSSNTPNTATSRGTQQLPVQATDSDATQDSNTQHYSGGTISSSSEDGDANDHSVPLPSEMIRNDCGKVMLIECTNFMCHRRFRISFNKSINFITGQNGSGKSAIVAALQICLGLSARNTSRGANLSSLIRHGSNSDATVAVELCNVGPFPFEFMSYGEQIRIERTLRVSGSSSFKIMNAKTQKVISRDRTTVTRMVRWFNIYVDNPSCILDQETSKTFLRGSPKDKYKIFMRATNLDDIKRMFSHQSILRKSAKEALKERLANLGNFEKRRKLLEDSLGRIRRLENQEEDLKKAMRQKPWIKVRDIRQQVQSSATLLAKLQAKLKEREEKAEHLQAQFEHAQKDAPHIQDQVTKIETEKNDLDDEMKRIAVTIENHMERRRQAKGQIVAIERTIKSFKADRSSCEEKREKLAMDAKRMNETAYNEAKRLRSMLDKKRRERDETSSQREVFTAQLTQLSEEHVIIHSHEDDKTRLQEQLDCKEREKNDMRANLSNIRGGAFNHDRTSCFGREMQKVLHLIEQNKSRFKHAPVHTGLNISLSDQKWRFPVEFHLRSAINRLVLFDNNDYVILKSLCRQANIPAPNVLIRKFASERYPGVDKNAFRPQSDSVVCMMDIIKTDNPNVFNVLVDMAKIESTGLCESSRVAEEVTFRHKPRNLSIMLDMQANTYQLRKNGNEYKQAYFGRSNKTPMLVEDTRELETSLRNNLQDAEKEMRQLSQQIQQIDATIRNSNQKRGELEQRIRETRHRELLLETEIQELQKQILSTDEKVKNDDEVEIERESLSQQIQNLDNEITTLEMDRERFVRDEEFIAHELQPVKEKQHALGEKLQQLDIALQNAQNELDKIEQSSINVVASLERAKSKKEETEKRMNEADKKHREESNRYDQARKMALAYTDDVEEDVPADLTFEQADANIRTFQQSLQADKQRVSMEYEDVDLDAIKLQLEKEITREKKSELLEEEKIEFHRIILERLKAGRITRELNVEQLKRSLKKRIGLFFDQNLSYRNHSGTVHFDDEHEALNFTWNKTANTQMSQDEGQDTSVKDAGQLSGGESSFTSLAFLMALGEAVQTPWRVMDEFDVFMDQDYRKISLELIVEAARRASDIGSMRQYILLTPHDVSSVPTASDVKIVRMCPPENDFGRVST